MFRDLGRSVVHYRKDWFDAVGLKAPKSLDDWYNVVKAMTLGDPDKNGKNDTYGMMVEKKYNQNADSMLTRILGDEWRSEQVAVRKNGNLYS